MNKPSVWGGMAGILLALLTRNAFGEVLKSSIGWFDPGNAEIGLSVGFIAYALVGAAGFCGLRRMLLGSGAAFWQSTLGRWLIGRLAGALVFGALLQASWMVSTFCLQQFLNFYIHVFGFKSAAQLGPVWMVLLYGWTLAMAVKSRTPAKILIGKGSKPLRRLYRSLPMGRGGSSRFAGLLEEWANPWRPGMIPLGASMYDSFWLVGVKDDRHMITTSMTGGGKDRTAIMPTMITYPGSILCIDVKGQIAAVTARRRQKMGQKVRIVAPLGVPEGLEDMVSRYNPLAELDPNALDYAERVAKIADGLVMPGGEKSVFFDQSARTVIAGVIDYVVRAPEEKLLLLEDHSKDRSNEEVQ